MKNDNLSEFMKIYKEELIKARLAKYPWPKEVIDQAIEKMKLAIINNTFNKHGYGLKNTCKRLGINHTYKAIKEYIKMRGKNK
jgi:transcriptional regulator with PAS, ATPase and Fis domain